MAFNSLNPIIRTVDNMLKYGGTCKVVITGHSEYNYETSSEVVTTKEYTVKMIAFDYLQRMSGYTNMADMLIRSGDKQLFMKMTTGMPLPVPGSDYVIYQNKKYSIVTLKDLNPSGTSSILLEVFIRE